MALQETTPFFTQPEIREAGLQQAVIKVGELQVPRESLQKGLAVFTAVAPGAYVADALTGAVLDPNSGLYKAVRQGDRLQIVHLYDSNHNNLPDIIAVYFPWDNDVKDMTRRAVKKVRKIDINNTKFNEAVESLRASGHITAVSLDPAKRKFVLKPEIDNATSGFILNPASSALLLRALAQQSKKNAN